MYLNLKIPRSKLFQGEYFYFVVSTNLLVNKYWGSSYFHVNSYWGVLSSGEYLLTVTPARRNNFDHKISPWKLNTCKASSILEKLFVSEIRWWQKFIAIWCNMSWGWGSFQLKERATKIASVYAVFPLFEFLEWWSSFFIQVIIVIYYCQIMSLLYLF